MDEAPASLAERLRARLRHGPMRFSDWMEACLYDTETGFYTAPGRSPTGTDGGTDFATNPTLHPFFARAVAGEIAAVQDVDAVYEFGGGRGDLARDAQAVLGSSVAWHHIERSPTHRSLQGRTAHLDDVPAGSRGVVIAHEFLDALPFHWLERRKADWAEIGVVADGERFAQTYIIPAREALEAAPVDAPEEQRVAAMAQARAWLFHTATRLERGRILIVDYGADDVWRRDPEGTVRTFQGHQEAGDPLAGPGSKDITASVDFRQLRGWAEEAGLDVVSDESQEEFLLRHGALDALNAQERDSVEGASRYLRLRQMLIPHAGGMGHAFRVLVLAKGSG